MVIRATVGSSEAGIVSLLSVNGLQKFEIPCQVLGIDACPGRVVQLAIEEDDKFAEEREQRTKDIQSRIYRSNESLAELQRFIQSDEFELKASRIYHDSAVVDWCDCKKKFKGNLYSIYDYSILVDDQCTPVDNGPHSIGRLSPEQKVTVRVIVNTSDGPMESNTITVRTHNSSYRKYKIFLSEGIEVAIPVQMTRTLTLEECDFCVISDVHGPVAKQIRDRLHVKTVTPEWLQTSTQ